MILSLVREDENAISKLAFKAEDGHVLISSLKSIALDKRVQ